MLKSKIKDSGFKIRFLSDQIGISYQAFYNKLENRTQFLASEIMKLSNLLKLSVEERNSIFFAESVN